MKKFLTVLAIVLTAICMGIAVAACSSETGEKSIKNLTYNGEMITWSNVKNAKNYKIKINNGEEKLVSQSDQTISYRYDSNGEDFDFYVEAVIKEGSDKNPTYSIHFENIGTVEGLAIEQGNLVWDPLENASYA